jgi:hypothetical protein
MAVDGGLAETLARSIQFGQVHGGDVRDFRDESQFTHDALPLSL